MWIYKTTHHIKILITQFLSENWMLSEHLQYYDYRVTAYVRR